MCLLVVFTNLHLTKHMLRHMIIVALGCWVCLLTQFVAISAKTIVAKSVFASGSLFFEAEFS